MFDLYLGSDLGLWTLKEVLSFQIHQIFTLDETTTMVAQSLGIKCYQCKFS